jgi:hypothetical protein
MFDWKEYCALCDEELDPVDIIEKNLACAVGLPDAADIDIERCVRKANDYAAAVLAFTEPRLAIYRRKPWAYNCSEAYFRVLAMITVLQRDCGVRYNPAKIGDDVPLDTADVFVHGAIEGEGGLCGTLPVLYVGVGRRLGYPLKLVLAHSKKRGIGHAFARWDDPPRARLNIEASGKGLNCDPDDRYRTGDFEMPKAEEKACGLLKSLTPREELAIFVSYRAKRWMVFGNRPKAVEAFVWSHGLWPENAMIWNWIARTITDWQKEVEARKPPGFPVVRLGKKVHPRFPQTVGKHVTNDVLYLEVTENLLNTPDLDRQYWQPLRRGQWLARRPLVAHVDSDAQGYAVQLEIGCDEGPFSYQSITT